MRPWDSLTADEQRLFIRMAEVFAGYISYADDQLGRVIDFLAESGQLDNTLIVVISGNGASGEGGPNGSFNEMRFFNGVADTAEGTLPHLDELGGPASYNHYNTGWAALTISAWTDLARRDPRQINGSKRMWAAIIAVNFIGPIAYFTRGRRDETAPHTS